MQRYQSDCPEPKQQLRKRLRSQRRSLSKGCRRQAERLIRQRLITHIKHRQIRRVACYLDADGEVPTRSLIRYCQHIGVEIYLPALYRGTKSLIFRRFTAATPLRPNRFSVLEPPPQQASLVSAKQLDAVLLPLVAFDSNAQRLGMGGGFYDTTFAFLHKHSWHPPRLIGLAYELQKIAHIPADPWDVPLHCVITESSTYPRSR